MKKSYDFSKSVKNPYLQKPKKQLTIRLDEDTIEYFRSLAAYSGPNWTPIPDQTGQSFRLKLDTDSGANWTLIPV